MSAPAAYDPESDTLSDVLARLGWTHEAGPHYSRRVTTDTGEVMQLRAHECWALLRERGLLAEVAP